MGSPLDQLSINTIRCLAMDAVQKAKSGHPGMPMGTAPMAYVLWTRHLRHNPANPQWWNRDRFILSPGHGCMLLYSLLHLTGYDLPLDELKNFRQWGSKTPGHSEYHHTVGVETTTGPLGQGFANGVGMAMAQKHLAAKFGEEICNYTIYAITSDGDLMEGVDSEAASLAGHLKLDNIIYLYDDNHISIEGDTKVSFTEDVGKRFEAYGWHVQTVSNGTDVDALDKAIQVAKSVKGLPHIIKIRTHIAEGSPNKHDSHEAHGAPLGEDEVKLSKKNLGWDPEKYFYIPDEVLTNYRKALENGKRWETEWKTRFQEFERTKPELGKEWKRWTTKELPKDWSKVLPVFKPDEKLATREASGKTINAIASHIPFLIGGSADLSPSTNTIIKDAGHFQAGSYGGRNLHFGVREHGMSSILNGIALSQTLIPYGATFLIFSDYAKPAVRLSAFMGVQSIFVYTHDSIGLGEDGPTHQSIEQLIGLRAIPNIQVLRPAEATETAAAWRAALERKDGPSLLILTRQKLPVIDRSKFPSADNVLKGAYAVADYPLDTKKKRPKKGKKPNLIIMATGSEVSLAMASAELLTKKSRLKVRVVSMPCWELFEKQSQKYKDSVLPPDVTRRVAIEMASPMGWHKYIGLDGLMIGMYSYGASAPAEILFEKFGFTPKAVVSKILKWIK